MNIRYGATIDDFQRSIDVWAEGGYGLPAADTIDAAWAEAEAALPEGWRLHLTRRPEGSTVATASNRTGNSATSYAQPTPAAALRSLASRLRERAG